MIHLQNWLNWSSPDYYSMFIKSWVPFNAWFLDSFYDETAGRTTDRSILDYIKGNSNKFRDKIISLMNTSGTEADDFLMHLGRLDRELESHAIYNRGERIQFSNTRLSVPYSTSKMITYGQFKYKCEKLTTSPIQWRCQIMRKSDGTNICHFSLTKWDINIFHNHPDYMSIRTNVQKKKLEECFYEINPRPIAKIVLPIKTNKGTKVRPPHSICIDSSRDRYFSDDKVLIAQILVEILYSLRCIMFHGSLDPTAANQSIYEHAYKLMTIITKELV